MATGTCLGAVSPEKNMHIIMDLCHKEDKSTISWDLIKLKQPLKVPR